MDISERNKCCRPRLIIADDHRMFSDALRTYLEKNFDVVGQVSDGRALIRAVMKQQPDAVIVDVGMPVLNGYEAARRIKEQAPKVKIIFLSMQDDPNLAAASLELGPVAFVLKHSAGSELLRAIDEVMRGRSYVTPKLKPSDWAEAKERVRRFSTELTPRQTDVVRVLAQGHSLKEAAELLQVSEKTVEFFKHEIKVTFNLKSNSDIVLFALKRGLISAGPAVA